MRLKSFRVEKYRCLDDTGDVAVEDVTVLIGKNESGKSTALRALEQINPAESVSLSLKDWPRRDRKNRNAEFSPITAEFILNSSEIDTLSTLLDGGEKFSSEITVSRYYSGQLWLTWDDTVSEMSAEGEARTRIVTALYKALERMLPRFVYMSELELFSGSAYLDEIKSRQESGRLSSSEETFIMLLDLSGLKVADLRSSSLDKNRSERQDEIRDGAKHLTQTMRGRWTQGDYKLEYTLDDEHFVTLIADDNSEEFIPLEEHSTGFQWFLSFDLRLMHGLQGDLKNSILLFDEPGLHLHGDAQADLLKRFDSYSKETQIIYATHMPFMIDMLHPERIRIVSKSKEPPQITENPFEATASDKFPLHAALGFSAYQSLFIGPYNLIVEGLDDFWILQAFSDLLFSSGQVGLNPQLVVTPSFGASKVPYQCSMLSGQKLNVAVLLDSDPEGAKAKNELIKKWILKDKFVFETGSVVSVSESTIEDLFDPAHYLKAVNAVYSVKLKADILASSLDPSRPILIQLEPIFVAQKVSFNKGSVAKQLVKDLPIEISTPEGNKSFAAFSKLIDLINHGTKSWFKGGK